MTFHSLDVEQDIELMNHIGRRVRLRARVHEHYDNTDTYVDRTGRTHGRLVRYLTGVTLIGRDIAEPPQRQRPETASSEFTDWWRRNIDGA
jgi:hypothetical protein